VAAAAAYDATLNNRVPPTPRTNNYWDNFRSYSRQNLLSNAPKMRRAEPLLFVPPQEQAQVAFTNVRLCVVASSILFLFMGPFVPFKYGVPYLVMP